MRHIPFLQALADASGTDDPVWRDASAGYLVLRFFDRWLEEGPARVSADTGLEGLRERIRSVPDVAPQVQDTLLKAIQEMVDAEEANPAVVVEPLLAYGKYLASVSRWGLAAYLYQTLIDALDSSSTSDPQLAAVLVQYGFVKRLLGDFDASDQAYSRAIALADKSGARVISLRAKIGQSNTLKARGNLGDAEILLDKVFTEAVESGIVNAESWARHARGAIRITIGRYVDAMIDLFRAYELTDDVSDQEFILSDIAACAGAAGYRYLARNSYRILAYTAHAPIARIIALGNLLKYAAQDGTYTDFKQLQAHIAVYECQQPVPAEYSIHIALHTAYGIERFGTRDEAITAYRSVISDAHDAGLHQIEFQTEERLAAFVAGTTRQDMLSIQEPPDVLRSVVDTIAEWSSLVPTPV